jgi:hypothetical protein
MEPQSMVDIELRRILDQNTTMGIEDRIKDGESHSLDAIAHRIEGNQKIWDTEIMEIFRCLQDIDVKIKEIVHVLLKTSS